MLRWRGDQSVFCDACGARLAGPVCDACGVRAPEPAPVTVPAGPVLGQLPQAADGGGAGLRRSPSASSSVPAAAPVDAGPAPEARPRPPLAHRPGPTVRAWILGATLRNVRGTLAGVVAAWFDLPLVLLAGAVGALVGGLAGAVSGTVWGSGVLRRLNTFLEWGLPLPVRVGDLLPVAAAQIGGIIGGILGAVHGAWILGYLTAVYPWQLLYADDPLWPWAVVLGQLLTGLFVGLLYTVWAVSFERFRLRVGGARRLSRREAEFLLPLLDEVAVRMDLPSVPTLLMDDTRTPNAYAGARHVVMTVGLVEEFADDPDALRGVLAHELTHWMDGAPVGRAWSAGVALPLMLLYELAVRVLDVTRWRPIQFVLRILLWGVLASVRYFVVPVQASTWRREEFRADQGALAAGYGEGIRRVLERLRDFEVGRGGWDKALCATHPPVELRLEALEAPEGRYPLPGTTGGPAPRAASTAAATGAVGGSTVRRG